MICNTCKQKHKSIAGNNKQNASNYIQLISNVRNEFVQNCKSTILLKQKELIDYCDSLNETVDSFPHNHHFLLENFEYLLKKCAILDLLYGEIIIVPPNSSCWLSAFDTNFSEYCKLKQFVENEVFTFQVILKLKNVQFV